MQHNYYWTQGALRDLILNTLPQYFQDICKIHKDAVLVLKLNPDESCKLSIIGDENAD